MAVQVTTRARDRPVRGERRSVVEEAATVAHRRGFDVEADRDDRRLRLRRGVNDTDGLVEAVEDIDATACVVNRESGRSVADVDAPLHRAQRIEEAHLRRTRRRDVDRAVSGTLDVRGHRERERTFGIRTRRVVEVNVRVQV